MLVVFDVDQRHCHLAGYNLLETRMLTAPAAASQLTFDKVGIDVRTQATIAAIATNTAVQVPCSETALSPIDTLKIAEPATKIQSGDWSVSVVQ